MYSYLHHTSYHPLDQKNSIAYSQSLRLRMICSELAEFKKSAQTLLKYLTLRGHPHTKVKESIERARLVDRKTLLEYNSKPKKSVIPFILQHNPHHQHAHQILRSANELWTGKIENRKFYANKIIVANNRAPNLRDILTSSTFPRPPAKQGSRPCMRLSCNTCESIICTKNITSTTTKEKFRIIGDNTCLKRNVVYVIPCPVCRSQYVGETGRTINERISEHKRDIRYRRRESPVAKHFLDHDVLDKDLLCTIIDSSPQDRNIRIRLEEAWIRLLKTMSPTRMNLKL